MVLVRAADGQHIRLNTRPHLRPTIALATLPCTARLINVGWHNVSYSPLSHNNLTNDWYDDDKLQITKTNFRYISKARLVILYIKRAIERQWHEIVTFGNGRATKTTSYALKLCSLIVCIRNTYTVITILLYGYPLYGIILIPMSRTSHRLDLSVMKYYTDIRRDR